MKSVLFLDKAFLKGRPSDLRGVEVFHITILNEMVRLGVPLTVVSDSSWEADRVAYLAHSVQQPIDWLLVPGFGATILTTPLSSWRLAGRSFETLFLGNVGKGICSQVAWLYRKHVFNRCVVFAHREASAGMLKDLLTISDLTVLAVNEKIAAPFRAAGLQKVFISPSGANSENFSPGEDPKPSDTDGIIRFCVIGQLDNAWKGADTAVEAFRRLPDGLKERCELHLASFQQPPTYPEKHIHVHRWIPFAEMPAFMRRMDIMLAPSRDENGIMRETFSQVTVQGMLTGLPVIASDLEIFKEKLEPVGNPIFHSVENLRDWMVRLAENRDERLQMGKQARKRAKACYIWSTQEFIKRYL